LHDIPVLDEFSFFNSENIDNCSFKGTRFDDPMVVDGNQVVFGYYSLEMVDRRGVLLPEIPEECCQALLAVLNSGIVLNVVGPQQLIEDVEPMADQETRRKIA
jgi:hypothetical protein